jgi:hypothetical protein
MYTACHSRSRKSQVKTMTARSTVTMPLTEDLFSTFQVRNLTYMVTRREKIKRTVCKVQEQIFNLYTKLLE